MSSPTPVHISELAVATAVAPTDTLPISQNGVDRQVPVSLLSGINWAGITAATILNPTDDVLIYQSGTKKISASYFNFPSGTKLWFFQATAPTGWSLVAYPGDALLALRGGSTYTNAGTAQGTWQQDNATLTIDQIPAHTHFMDTTFLWPGAGSPSSTKVGAGRNGGDHEKYVPDFPTGGAGSNLNTSSGNNNAPNTNLPLTNGHNHGAAWRPAAYVGIICTKD